MKTLLVILACICVSCASSNTSPAENPRPVPKLLAPEVPDLFKTNAFTCATLAEAANYYIALGEVRAIKKLKALEEELSDMYERWQELEELNEG